jgi:hypothetical protein
MFGYEGATKQDLPQLHPLSRRAIRISWSGTRGFLAARLIHSPFNLGKTPSLPNKLIDRSASLLM